MVLHEDSASAHSGKHRARLRNFGNGLRLTSRWNRLGARRGDYSAEAKRHIRVAGCEQCSSVEVEYGIGPSATSGESQEAHGAG